MDTDISSEDYRKELGAQVRSRDLRQILTANADVMFYKTDTMQHRQRLINIFPYALCAYKPG